MDLPTVSWQTLAWQIPLALVIVVLVIYFLKHLEKNTKEMLDFLREQSNLNRDFLKQQNEQHNLSIGRLAEEIKNDKIETVKEIAALTQRVDSVIDKAIMLERLLPEKRKGTGD